MTYSTKALACSFLLCPALHSMQDPHDINLALVRAASNCDSRAYHRAANQALDFAGQHPHDFMQHLGAGIAFSTPNPDLIGHTLAISYDLIFNSRIHVAFSLARALTSVLTFWPTPLSHREYARLPIGPRLINRTSAGLHEIGLYRHLWNRSWNTIPKDIAGIVINVIPAMREESLVEERRHFLEALSEIDLQQETPRLIRVEQPTESNVSPAA